MDSSSSATWTFNNTTFSGNSAGDEGGGMAVTHGNAVSVYFKDPEGNGIEVFCDTPWNVRQPVLEPWDPSQSDAQVLAGIEQRFRNADGFEPMADYQARRAQALGEA